MKRSVVIIGAGSSLSGGIILALKAAQWDVALMDINPEKAVGEALKYGVDGVDLPVDVTDYDCLKTSLQREFVRKPFSAVVNGTGSAGETSLSESPTALWRQIVEVNLLGAANLTAALAHIWNGVSSSHVLIHISSINAKVPVPRNWSYCASKAGLEMLVKTSAIELATTMRVNAVAPGPLEPKSGLYATFPALLSSLRRSHPLEERLTNAADVAGTIAFLLSDGGAWLTGETITVDGGLTLALLSGRSADRRDAD